MPVLTPERNLISLRVADRVVGDTRICQLATLRAFHHTQAANGAGTVTVEVEVALFAAQGQELGPALTGGGFSTRIVRLGGDNLTLVDAATGDVLATRTNESEPDWQAILDSFAQPTMLQGDFFLYLRDNQTVAIGELIRTHIQRADALGRFA